MSRPEDYFKKILDVENEIQYCEDNLKKFNRRKVLEPYEKKYKYRLINKIKKYKKIIKELK